MGRSDRAPAHHPPFALRTVVAGDERFLSVLYADRRREELPTDLIDMQFRARQLGYQAAFPGAEDALVLVEGEPVGRVMVDRDPGRLRVVDVAILGEHRGRGLGTALLEKIQAEAVPIDLTVDAGEARLRRWYERLGFTVASDDGVHVRMVWDPDGVG